MFLFVFQIILTIFAPTESATLLVRSANQGGSFALWSIEIIHKASHLDVFAHNFHKRKLYHKRQTTAKKKTSENIWKYKKDYVILH